MKPVPSTSSRLVEWLRTESGYVLLVMFGCGLFAIGCGSGQPAPANNIPPGDVGLMIQGCPGDIESVAATVAGTAVAFSGYSAVYDASTVISGDPQYPLNLTLAVSKASGTVFALGTTVVTITATLSGYTTNHVAFTAVTVCSFTVTVGWGPNACTPPPGAPLPPGNYPIGTCDQGGLFQIPLNSTPVDGVQGCDGNIYCKSGVFLGTGTTDLGHPECALSYFTPDGFDGATFSLSDAQNGGIYVGPIVQVRAAVAGSNVFFVCKENGAATNSSSIIGFGNLGAGLHIVRPFTATTVDINNQTVPDLKYPTGLAADGYGRAWVVAKGGGANGVGGISSVFWDGTGYKLMYSFSASEFPMYSPVVMTVAGRVTICVNVLNLTTKMQSVLFLDADGGTHSSVDVTAGSPGSGNPPNDSRCSPLVINSELYAWNGPRSSAVSSNNPCRLYKVLPPAGTAAGNSTLITTLPTDQNQTVINSAVGPDNRVYTVLSDASGTQQSLHTAPLNGSTPISVLEMTPNSFVVHDSLNLSAFVPDIVLDTGAALIPLKDGSARMISSVQFSGDIFGVSPDMIWPQVIGPGPGNDPGGIPVAARAADSTNASRIEIQDFIEDGPGSTVYPQAQLTVPTNHTGLNAGRGLALNGDVMLVGVPFGTDTNFAGAVQVFRRDITNWVLESTLTPPTNDNAALFGFSVAMNQDTAVVGAPGGINAATRAGAAYVFRQQGAIWNQEARLTNSASPLSDEFGAAVAIDMDSIVVGAPGTTNGGDHAGRAYIFQRSNSVWTQKAVLNGPGATTQDYFGAAVAIRGTNAVVGAPRSDGFKQTYKFGAAYAYRFTGTSWILSTGLTNLARYGADLFGASVAAGEGFFAVGAPGMNPLDSSDSLSYRRGVHVFVNNLDTRTLRPASPVPMEMFGASVSVDGARVTVGAPRAIEAGVPQSIGGSGYVFDNRVDGWQQSARLAPADPQGGDLFGLTVAASSEWIGVSSIIHANTNALIGSAYAFNVAFLPAPRLNISPVGPMLQLDWTSGFNGFVLEHNTSPGSTNWVPVAPAPASNSYILSPSGAAEYFRLHRP